MEAIRLIAGMTDPARFSLLAEVAGDPQEATLIRAEAIVGLTADAAAQADLLVGLAAGPDTALRDEALRALVGTALSGPHELALRQIASRDGRVADAVARILGDARQPRPSENDVDAWLALLDGGDATAGRRVFMHDKVGMCVRCHMAGSRGNRVGPELTRLAVQPDRRKLLESILQPSREIAPQFIPWVVVTTSGQTFTGFTLTKGRERERYMDATGKEVEIAKSEIDSVQQTTVSLMPAGLHQTLTIQELRDLLSFLMEKPSN
jgi:putative heme-binding domain-containing protein